MPKNILLGISGCISAYKMPEYVRFFIKKGYEVKVILTSCAQKFVTETTLATLSRNPVYIDIFAPENGWMPQHIALAQWADVFLCAPLSADMLSKVASGFSNDLLLATLLAYEGSVVLCPSMNDVMYKNEVIQSHLNSLKKIDRYSFIEPVKGDLACLSHGIGRLPSVQNIYEKIILFMKICVTAGPTREFIDPVRFISSPSSGKMGYFLAQEMLKQGHEVTLISGPVSLKKPTGIIVKYVQTAKEMRDQVVKGIANFDVLVMTAAVCDYSLPEIHTNKIKKNDSELVLSLVENPDILKEVSKVDHDAYVVGFAAESEDLIENARKKMFEKKLNMIVANDITQKETGFASDDFEGFILRSDGSLENIAKCSKSIASKCILKAICEDICES